MSIKKAQALYIILLIIGLLVLFSNPVVIRIIGINKNLIRYMGAINGLGGYLFGLSSIRLYKLRKHPEKYEQEKIDKADEHNVAIRDRAAYSTYLLTIFLTVAMAVIFFILDVFWAEIISIAVLLIVIISFSIFSRYYRRKL